MRKIWWLAAIPAMSVAIFTVLVAAFNLFSGAGPNPPNLLLSFNLIFITGTNVVVAILSAQSYLREGSSSILVLGCALLVSGLGAVFAGWASGFSANANVTIFNIAILLAGVLQVLAGFLTMSGSFSASAAGKKNLLVFSYSIMVVFVLAISATALAGGFPQFFTAAGPTLVREVVLTSAACLFGLASLLFIRLFLQSKSIVLFLYWLGLGTVSVGLFGSLFVTQFAAGLAWLTRTGQYLGGLYFLAAIVFLGFGGGQGIGFSAGWTAAFMNDKQQLDTLFSKMLNGFSYHRIIVDKEGKPIDYVFLAANEAFEKMTGLKREIVIGRKVTEVLPGIEKDPADWIGIYGKVALYGQPAVIENYAQPLKKWYSVSAYSPRKGYFVAIFEDITERKKAEEVTRLSEEKYRLLVETPNSIVMTVDKDLNVTYMNRFGLDFFGYTAEELLGKNVLGTTVPLVDDEGKDLSEMAGDVIKNPEKYKTNVHKNMRKDGTLVWVSWTNSPRYDQNGSLLEVLSIGNDLTNLRETEEKLRKSEVWEATSFYTRNLIEASPDPLVTISPEGKITDVNKATEQATGCSRDQLIGSDFSDYFTEPEKARAGYKRVFTDGFVKDYPLAIRHKSGRITEVLYNATVYKDQSGTVQGVFAAARDVTELRKAEEQARESAQKLKDTERLATIGATAGMVGHDIRNPLQAIAGDVYLAKSDLALMPDGEAKEGMKESLLSIEKNVDYINKIVQDLQDFARPLNPVSKEIDLRSICEDLLLKTDMPKNIKCLSKVSKSAGQVSADPELLRRVLSNLVINAIQAMPHGGKLSISAYRRDNNVFIKVRDTGVGIPDEMKSQLFTPLFTTKSKGQGFGLAVVKRVTESMNGTVTFKSETGRGTTFTIRLPSTNRETCSSN